MMKRSWGFTLSVLLSLLGMLVLMNVQTALAAVGFPQVEDVGPQPGADNMVQALYFYANDCQHCLATLDETIYPLEEEFDGQLEVRLLEIGIPENYEAMLAIEQYFSVEALERSIPTLVVGDQILIGETEVRENFPQIVAEGIAGEGIPFLEIPGVNFETLVSSTPVPTGEPDETCETDESCEVDAPIYVAYFYQTGCDECSRVNADLEYLKTRYPQMQVVEFNIYDEAGLAAWLVEQIGFEGDFHTPALIIGDQVLIGEEILPDVIAPVLDSYLATGTEPLWLNYDPDEGRQTVVDRFKNMGWLTVVAAGLVDGINPCAFATLIFFISYLTLSGRKGKEVLLVGGAFTLGVFVAYLAVGLGLYQMFEHIGATLDLISKIVYGVTGVFCLVLAVLSFIDYGKARQGKVEDMLLKLPEPLRKQINATIRKGRNTRNYIAGAFVAGLLVSFLELACTGQVYLPTIIFVSSIPEMRGQAIFYLILYNLLFILPLVVIFVLVYFGTTSKDLTRFLQERAAAVKFAMGIIFIALGAWLILSLVR